MSARSRRECAVLPPQILYANFCCLFEPFRRPDLNPEIYGSRSYMFELAAGRELDKIKILCYNSKKSLNFCRLALPRTHLAGFARFTPLTYFFTFFNFSLYYSSVQFTTTIKKKSLRPLQKRLPAKT